MLEYGNDERDLNDMADILDMMPIRRTNIIRPDWFATLGEKDFRDRFRLTKGSVLHLAERLDGLLGPQATRRNTISTMDKLLITLRYYLNSVKIMINPFFFRFCASGLFQIINGDLFDVHQTTVSRIVAQTLYAIASLSRDYIKMPATTRDLNLLKQSHFEMIEPHGIPNVIGFIDCTHVKIFSPGGVEAERYRNRKGYFSINVQAVCDSSLKFLDVVARWPGSTHDSHIFDMSVLKVLEKFIFLR